MHLSPPKHELDRTQSPLLGEESTPPPASESTTTETAAETSTPLTETTTSCQCPRGESVTVVAGEGETREQDGQLGT